MQTAISTGYCRRGSNFNPEDVRASLKAVADAGITHVHWAYQWGGAYMFTDEDIAFAAQLLKEYGLKAKGIHGTHGWAYENKTEGIYKWGTLAEGKPYIASFDEDLRKQASDLVMNRVRLAEAIGAHEVVLHVQLPYMRFADAAYKDKFYAQVFKTFDENEAFARKTGVRICIENLIGTPNAFHFEEFDRLFDRYSPDYMGYCCDTGHLYLADPADPFCVPRKYTDRIFMIHLNDNHGPVHPGDFSDDMEIDRSDEHYVMGDACVDFDTFAGILARSPYELPVVGEFAQHGEELNHYLNRCRERMEAFSDKVTAIREGYTLKP